MNTDAATNRFSYSGLFTAASGRIVEILERVGGIPSELLDGKHHPCPKCRGTDRFRLIHIEDGAVLCNQCFATENGNFISAVAWMRGWKQNDAALEIAKYLGVDESDPNEDIVAAVARDKSMPVAAFKQFGAVPAKRGKMTVARVPVYDGNGDEFSYFDLAPRKKGLAKPGKGTAGMFFPGRLPKPGESWLLGEGVKDPAALVGMGYLAAGMPGSSLSQKFAQLFTGCNVGLVHDLDKAGVEGTQKTGKRLAGIATSVKVIRLPGEIKESHGDDVRDVLRRSDGERLVREAIAAAVEWTPTSSEGQDDQPKILVGLDEALVADQVITAIGAFGWGDDRQQRQRIYQRVGQLVHVTEAADATVCGVDIPEAMLRIRPLPTAILREQISSAVRLETPSEDDEETRQIRPPQWLVNAIHQRGQWPKTIRLLTGIIRCPTLRPDGTVIQSPGYDQRTGLLFAPDGQYPPIADHPSKDDAIRAADELLDVVCDFPFAGPQHRSVWLAFDLTLVGRAAIRGPCPLFVIDANTPGSGKSLLSDAAGFIAYGHDLARKQWPGDDNEVRKTITAMAMESVPAVLWDNIATTLGCSSLDAALTGTSWQDRILGTNTTTGTLPLTTVWGATGNNIVLAADTARRTLYCRVESPMENPEERTGFKYPSLIPWVRQHRHRLAAAAVTILRAYVAAGAPSQGLTPWGSFEAWSGLIRHAIVWVGLPDPWETRTIVRAADRSAELLRLVLDGIEETDSGDGVTGIEIWRLLSHPLKQDEMDPYSKLRAAVAQQSCVAPKWTPGRLAIGCEATSAGSAEDVV